jgi:hypothetical protein
MSLPSVPRCDEQFSKWVATTSAAEQLKRSSSSRRRGSDKSSAAPNVSAPSDRLARAVGPAGSRRDAAARFPENGRASSRESKASAQERKARETQALRELSVEAIEQILSLEKTPMLVVEWAAFASHGRIPISGERLARARVDGDVVVFVSHRWWGDGTPDDEVHTKYELVCAGVREIIAKHALAAERVALWVDDACISQEDLGLMADGIASLITYAARSSFVLIPVAPTVEAMSVLDRAVHPFDLIN